MSSVYDLFDGCSLIAKRELRSSQKIRFLTFWNDRNDRLAVFALDKTVSFFSIVEKSSTSDESATSKNGTCKELKEDRLQRLDYHFDVNDHGLFASFTLPSKMWIMEEGNERDGAIYISRVTEEECTHVEFRDTRFIFPSRIRIGENVASIEELEAETPQQNQTYLFDEIDFQNNIQTTPIVVQGACVALNGIGRHVIVWSTGSDGQNVLNLHSNELSRFDVSNPIAYIEIGRGVLGVQAVALNRETWASDDKNDTSLRQLPLVCVMRIKRSDIDVLVWDADSGRVLTRIDVAIEEVSCCLILDLTALCWH